MKKKVSKELHRQTLLEAAHALRGVDYCVFYGTALGLHRDGDLIDGDDDVDLFVKDSDFENVDTLLKESGFRSSQEVNGQPVFPGIFSQYYKIRESEICLLDIYFYHDVHEKFVVDKWNVCGRPDNKETFIIFPKDMIFDCHEVEFFGEKIKTPKNPESLCRYIYGNRFREPLAKGSDYFQRIINNRFVVVYNR
tara:strand:- start:5515 stop:6096 length:582 start_codon:yes stop_codon:yes gene_type:complete